MSVVIRARLSLAIRLIDTTTGRVIEETDIRFNEGSQILKPINKGEGIWVFTGESRKDFSMHIAARDYDEADIDIRFETLNPKLPMCDVFLMPSEKNRKAGSVISIHGHLSKLESIEAVAIDRPICRYRETSEKRGVICMSLMPMTIGGRVVTENMRYALLSEDGSRYEVFEIIDQVNQTQVVLKDMLKGEHKINERVCRIIYGRAGPNDEVMLKVRDDGSNLPYLIHFTAGGNEYFRPIDFHYESGEIDLKDKAVMVKPITGKDTTDYE